MSPVPSPVTNEGLAAMLHAATLWLFSNGGLTPHGFCLLWDPWLIWTEAGANALVGMAYFTIPAALAIYARRRRDAVFRPVIWLFAAFIMLCGTGHWLNLVTLWVPVYRFECLVKAATGIVSAMTAVAVWRLLPVALRMPTTQQLQQAQDELRESQVQFAVARKTAERLQTVIEASPTALVLAGPEGRIRTVNASAERLFGYARSELEDRSLDSLLPEPARPSGHSIRDEFMNRARARATAGSIALPGLRKDGSQFPMEIELSPTTLDGEVLVLAGINDVTERHEAERVMQERQLALEQSNAELTRATRRAEQATRAKSLFLASMSHELRTPLNGILGYAQLLGMEGGLTAKQSARVDAMRGAGQHLLEMITSVLDLSEIETGRMTLQKSVVEPRSLAADCMDVIRPKAEAKGLQLGMQADAFLPDRIVADPIRLRQVILNLLGNAAKFTAAGRIDLGLHVVQRQGGTEAEGARLQVAVADTGRGIPPDQRHRLFQDFQRLASDAGLVAEGTGLGLAISARLMDLMGGCITYSEREGGGSVFTLDLPLKPADGSAPAVSTHATREAPPVLFGDKPPKHGPLRIMVVDDSAMNREVASSFLRDAGHSVFGADGGEAAVRAAQASDFDIILMDLRMPEVDGFEATRRIHALGGPRSRVRIVALTAHAFSEQIEECRRAGMVGHLAKPFTQPSLLQAIAAALDDTERRSEGPSGEGRDADFDPLPILDVETFETTGAFLSADKIAIYLDDLARRIESMLTSLRSRENGAAFSDDLIDSVHALAGAVALIGFVRLGAVARNFERAVRRGAADVPALALALTDTLDVTLAEICRRQLRSKPAEGEQGAGQALRQTARI